MAHHSHHHDSAHHHAHHHHGSSRSLLIALAITAGFAVVELLGGLWANSLALIGDAGHMTTDAAALALGALAAQLSRRGPTRRYTYGLRRAEVVGALVNVLFMFGVIAAIGVAAVQRLQDPEPVGGLGVMAIAGVGLVVNLLALKVLHGGEQSLNTRGAILHVMGDLLGSVAALAAGLVVWLTGWNPIDPLLSLFICVLIAISSTRLLLESLHVVMEGTPSGVSVSAVGTAMATAHPAIQDVHDLHIWSVSSDLIALSAHVRIDAMDNWPPALEALQQTLHDEFGIEHVTLQPELAMLQEQPLLRMT